MMSFINSFDLAAAEFAAAIAKNCGFLTTPLKIITLSGTAGAVFIVAVAMLIIFQRTRTTGIKAGGALLIGFIFTNLLLKNIIARPRPYADVTSRFYEIWQSAGALKESGFSFPSGHTTAATAFGVSLFISLNKKYSWTFLFIPLVMGFTRIYFCVHYASDVLGGIVVGTTAAILSQSVYGFIMKKLSINAKNSN